MRINHPQRNVKCGLFLFLLLVSCLTGTTGHTLITDDQQSRRDGTPAPAKWEKVYADPRGATFKAIYSAPLQLKKASSLRWLWIGDAQGFVRLAVLDADSSVLFEPDQMNSQYFGLSKLAVSSKTARFQQPSAPVSALSFFENNAGYMVSGNNLYATEDNGFNWDLDYHVPDLSGFGTATLFSLAVIPSKKACTVGMYSQPTRVTKSLVLCTEKSLEREHRRWTEINVPTQTQLFDIFFLDDHRGWIVGAEGMILKTDDAGDSWEIKMRAKSESLLNIYFVDRNNGWAVGRLGTILHSQDGGNNWTRETPDFYRQISSLALRSVRFAKDKKTGWIVGDRGTILQTNDGGRNWQLQQAPVGLRGPRPDLHALFIDGDFCWAVGTSSTVWRYRWR